MNLLVVGFLGVLTTQAGAQRPACAPGNGGLALPKGFCAVLVAESLGTVRHLAVAGNGDIFVAKRAPRGPAGGIGGIVVLRDADGDGKAELVSTFYDGPGGSGIALAPDAVYFGQNDRILRFPWSPGALKPTGMPEIIATGLPVEGHDQKGIALGPGEPSSSPSAPGPTAARPPIWTGKDPGPVSTRAPSWSSAPGCGGSMPGNSIRPRPTRSAGLPGSATPWR